MHKLYTQKQHQISPCNKIIYLLKKQVNSPHYPFIHLSTPPNSITISPFSFKINIINTNTI